MRVARLEAGPVKTGPTEKSSTERMGQSSERRMEEIVSPNSGQSWESTVS